MGGWVMNARMYAVTPAVEALWRALLGHVTRDAGVPLEYVSYPAPQPLEALWSRRDLGAAFMCGFPIALGLAPVQVIAAPVPRAPWAAGRPLYRTDLIVRADAPYQRLEDTFGARSGWTVAHSHSGFNAWRHHLLGYRQAQHPRLYGQMRRELITARAVLDAVREGAIDVGPLDAYWHLLIARHAPELTAGIRVLGATATAPIPPLVAAAGAPASMLQALRGAFLAAAGRPWFAPFGEELLLERFSEANGERYAPLLEWDRQARAAGYPEPA